MAFAWNEKTFWLIQRGGWELPAIGIARRPGFPNNQTMIIDAHHHYVKEDGYLEQLVAEARRLGIDATVDMEFFSRASAILAGRAMRSGGRTPLRGRRVVRYSGRAAGR